MNRFLSWCETETTLPAICTSQPEAVKPRFSQVCGLILLPFGAVGPASWVSATDMNDVIDNTDTDNEKAKLLNGRGGLEEPEPVIINMGRRTRHKAGARYRLEFEASVTNDGQYALAQKLQGNYTAFRFWFLTYGGRTFGGQNGIEPDFVDAALPLGASHEDVEKAVIRIEWYADASPSRTDSGGSISSPSGGVTPSPVSSVGYYRQPFASATSNVLTWTENSGNLPATNTAAQVWVFQEGQKLEETAQYSITNNTAPGESQITINAATHYSGSNYEVIVFYTS